MESKLTSTQQMAVGGLNINNISISASISDKDYET